MGLRRGKRAVALAVAVVAGSLGAPPAVVAAPPAPGTTATPTPGTAGADLSVWPRPQSLRANGDPVAVTDEVALLTDPSADPHAVEALRALLRQAGARRVTDSAGPGALVVRAGTEPARRNDRHALPSGGTSWPSAGAASPSPEPARTDCSTPCRHCGSCCAPTGRSRRPSYATGPAPPYAASPRVSTAPRGRTGSGWRRSASWGAPSRTVTCTPPATTSTGRPAGVSRTRRSSGPSSGSWPSGPAATTCSSAGRWPRGRRCASPRTPTCGR